MQKRCSELSDVWMHIQHHRQALLRKKVAHKKQPLHQELQKHFSKQPQCIGLLSVIKRRPELGLPVELILYILDQI